MSAKKPDRESFEKILEKLETVVRDLESNEVPLERALERFVEGVRLSREGAGRLEEAERRIEEILADGTTRALDPHED
jgi:exodeoxyribonuclease VII small subunit